jgi:hypothetical protein
MFTKTTLSTALTAIVFGVAVIALPVPAQAHGPGNHGPSNHGPFNQNGPKNFDNKPMKTTSNPMSRHHRRKHSGDANDIDFDEDADACKWIKKNGRDVKVCADDDDDE